MTFKKPTILLIILLISSITVAQESVAKTKNNFNFIGIGYTIGQIMPPLSIFPETKNQQGFELTVGTTNFRNENWAKLLNYPKTGILLSYTDFGNQEKVGYGLTMISHETVYDLDKGDISAIKDRHDGKSNTRNVEAAATVKEYKVADEIKRK